MTYCYFREEGHFRYFLNFFKNFVKAKYDCLMLRVCALLIFKKNINHVLGHVTLGHLNMEKFDFNT